MASLIYLLFIEIVGKTMASLIYLLFIEIVGKQHVNNKLRKQSKKD
jgi:hypothetical protein